MEVVNSLQMKDHFSKDVADLALTLAQALTECHIVSDAEIYLELLLTIPDFHTSQVYDETRFGFVCEVFGESIRNDA